jgi:hypothetical protein
MVHRATVSHADLIVEVVKLEVWPASIFQRKKDEIAPVTTYS